MRKTSTILLICLLIFCVVYTVGCNADKDYRVELSENAVALLEGGTKTLSVEKTPDNGRIVKWSSSDNAIATIKEGKITALKQGTAVVSAEVGGVKTSCKVYVFTEEDFTFESVEEGYRLVKCNADISEFSVFAEYQGVPVVEIGANAFKNKKKLHNVIISDNIKYIGESAFQGCNNLMKIKIGKNVQNIEANAFKGCYKLVEIYNDSYMDIVIGSEENGGLGYYAWDIFTDSYAKSNLTEVDDYVFYCSSNSNFMMGYIGSETSLVLPNDINGQDYIIYDYAFYSNKAIRSVNIGEKVTSIGEYAFYACNSLKEVKMTDNVNYIGSYAFSLCTRLSDIELSANINVIRGHLFSYCCSLMNINIPEGVIGVEEFAFYECAKLIEVHNSSRLKFEEGSTKYGYLAYNVKNIYSDTEGKSGFVNYGDFLFFEDDGSYYLMSYYGAQTELVLPDSYNGNSYSLYSYSLLGNTEITKITIGNSVTKIGYGALSGCVGLTEIVIPDSVIEIGECAFIDCVNITDVVLGEGVTILGALSFAYCSSLKSFNVRSGVKTLGEAVFSNCENMESIVIAESVEKIGGGAFYNCLNLTIFCEAESKPEGWHKTWNPSDRPVVWNYVNN